MPNIHPFYDLHNAFTSLSFSVENELSNLKTLEMAMANDFDNEAFSQVLNGVITRMENALALERDRSGYAFNIFERLEKGEINR